MSEAPQDRRKFPRQPMNIPALVTVLLPEQTFHPKRQPATIVDLSLGGVKVEVSGVPESFYKQLLREVRYGKVHVFFPEVNHETELHGKIVWVHYNSKVEPPVCSYGIMFEKLTPIARADIEAALAARRVC